MYTNLPLALLSPSLSVLLVPCSGFLFCFEFLILFKLTQLSTGTVTLDVFFGFSPFPLDKLGNRSKLPVSNVGHGATLAVFASVGFLGFC